MQTTLTPQTIPAEQQAICCPGCVTRIMVPLPDGERPDVTHYICGCGYGLGIQRDSTGVVQAWREGKEIRN